MSEKRRGLRKFAGNPLVESGIIAGIATIHTAWMDHRQATHRSIQLHEPLNTGLNIAGSPFTTTKYWAGVHLDHHSTPDINLYPAVRLANLAAWLSGHREYDEQFPLPEKVWGLDPAIPYLNTKKAIEIGEQASTLVEGSYVPPKDYSDADINEMLYSRHPKYFYEKDKGDSAAVPTVQDETASLWDRRFELRDPHSPALHKLGIIGILRYNRPLYEDDVAYYTQNRDRLPEHLQLSDLEEYLAAHKKQTRLALVGGAATYAMLIRDNKNLFDYLRSGVYGALATGIGAGILIVAGKMVNGLGHGGAADFMSRQFLYDLKHNIVRVKPNGTYTTNNALLSPATLGEVGGQFEHHEDPRSIAYTHEKGLKKFVVDPYGTTTEFMARHNIAMSVGPGFEGRRPDLPSDAALMVEAERRMFYEKHPEANGYYGDFYLAA
ncbi:MAG: hypothetical protein KA604_00330 [Candidatus Saccharimonas sp.]|nr:hypothetical protein [Candidatus Saccharimonas sp.]